MSNQKPDGIRLIAFDVDGVFTDGRFYLSDEGIESKSFHTQDGYGIRQLLKAGIAVSRKLVFSKLQARTGGAGGLDQLLEAVLRNGPGHREQDK